MALSDVSDYSICRRTGRLSRRGLLRAGGAALTVALTGCAADRQQVSATMSSSSSASSGSPAASSTLLVYFSRAGENYWNGGRRTLRVGNTKVLAGMIADWIDCDTYEIVAADPYPDAYDPTVARNVSEQNADARPKIAGRLPDVRGYDTVLIGSPIWASHAPMIMSTFVESVDLAGKTVLPFVTYAVSGMSGADDAYRSALPASTVAAGLAVRGETVADAATDLETWLRANDLIR